MYLRRRIFVLTLVCSTLIVCLVVVISLLNVIVSAIGSAINSNNQPVETNVPAVITSLNTEPIYHPTYQPKPSGLELTVVCQDQRQILVGTVKYGPIASCGDTQAYSIASITKIITALVVLDNMTSPAELDAVITADATSIAELDHSSEEGGTVLQVFEGEQFTKRTALEGMLLVSANNVADTLARAQFGTMEQYLSAARHYLDVHALVGVQLGQDASGLDNGTKATPQQLFLLGQLALENPILAAVVASPMTKWPTADSGGTFYTDVPNYNPLIDLGYNGIKPGYTDEAGRCLLFSKVVGDDTIIGVTLGDMNMNNGFSYFDAQRVTDQLVQVLEHQ